MTYTKETRIGVLLGGLSKEREISLRTGAAVVKALKSLGYQNVSEVDVSRGVAADLAKNRIELAFICLHGRFGEDGSIQGLLEFLKIPYTGSGILGSAVAMDKGLSKILFENQGVATPPWKKFSRQSSLAEITHFIREEVGLPAVAKPPSEGSTIGLSIVRSESEIADAQKTALSCEDAVLWEKFIDGKELTVSILEDRALPVIEIVPVSGVYNYESKYTKGKTDYYCPARISAEETRLVQEAALKAYHAVGASTYARVDVLLEKQNPWVLEVNTIPGMTETSLLPKAAQAAGISFEALVETLLQKASLKITGNHE